MNSPKKWELNVTRSPFFPTRLSRQHTLPHHFHALPRHHKGDEDKMARKLDFGQKGFVTLCGQILIYPAGSKTVLRILRLMSVRELGILPWRGNNTVTRAIRSVWHQVLPVGWFRLLKGYCHASVFQLHEGLKNSHFVRILFTVPKIHWCFAVEV